MNIMFLRELRNQAKVTFNSIIFYLGITRTLRSNGAQITLNRLNKRRENELICLLKLNTIDPPLQYIDAWKHANRFHVLVIN